MRRDIIELSSTDASPEVRPHRNVVPVSPEERRQHAPDRTLLLIDRGHLLGRCSCWWTTTASVAGERLGIVGHYAAGDRDAGVTLLGRAADLLAEAGCQTIVGPMDGSTWRRYRFITDRGQEPVFFLEPDNPDEWPREWIAAGFTPLATYTSALNDRLEQENPRTESRLATLAREGVRIRPATGTRVETELRRIFHLSLTAFARNFLYTPIEETEFVAQYQAVLPYVRPELVLLAERADELLGFMFAVPDVLAAQRGSPVDTVILKTVAVDPRLAGSGLGSAMLDLVQREARQLGFRRAIHALIHETNISRQISGRYARTFRRYALFSRGTGS